VGTAFAISEAMRRVFGDTITSIGAMLLVLVSLVLFDDRVRERARALVGGEHPTAQLVSVGERARDLAVGLLQVARDQSLDHAPLMIFALVAMVLVLFMLRS
jgi:hypothetical protein